MSAMYKCTNLLTFQMSHFLLFEDLPLRLSYDKGATPLLDCDLVSWFEYYHKILWTHVSLFSLSLQKNYCQDKWS